LHLGFPLSDEDTSDIDIQHQPVGKDNRTLQLGFPLSDDEGNMSDVLPQPVLQDNRSLHLGFPLSDEDVPDVPQPIDAPGNAIQ